MDQRDAHARTVYGEASSARWRDRPNGSPRLARKQNSSGKRCRRQPDHLTLLHTYKRAGVDPIQLAKYVHPSSLLLFMTDPRTENEASLCPQTSLRSTPKPKLRSTSSARPSTSKQSTCGPSAAPPSTASPCAICSCAPTASATCCSSPTSPSAPPTTWACPRGALSHSPESQSAGQCRARISSSRRARRTSSGLPCGG